MEKIVWYLFILLTITALSLSTCSQKEMTKQQSDMAKEQNARLKEIADRLKPIEALNESIRSIANEIKERPTTPLPQSDVNNALQEQLAGMGLSAAQIDALIEDVLKEFRAQLESGSGDVRRDIGDQILGRASSVLPPQLIEKTKPLWEAAVRKAIEASTLPQSVKSGVMDRLLKYGDKAVETLISELVKSGLNWAKGALSPDSGKEPQKIEVHVTCPGTCPLPPPGPPQGSSAQASSFVIPFRSGSFSLKEQNQVQQLWRARNHYNERLASRPGYGLTLRGHTDTTGDERRNVRLRVARAHAVACELIRLGVPRSALRVDSSQSKAPIPVAGKVAIPLNRTVVVEEGALDSAEPMLSC